MTAIRTGLGRVSGSGLIALAAQPDSELHWFTKLLEGEAEFSLTYQADSTEDPP